MKIAVFSDIHGNMDAFQQVLRDIDQARIDAMVCLGDNIGYGPEPEQVMTVIRNAAIPSVLGNHDLVALNPDQLSWFNPLAAESLLKTIPMLSDASLSFMSELKTAIVRYGARFVHGFPPDSPTTYLFQVSAAHLQTTMAQMKERICFIGHTHELRIIGFDGQKLIRDLLCQGVTKLDPTHRYILNIGSVGQPRDGDNRAKYVIWDTVTNEINVRFITYDIEKVVKKIVAAGLPKVHATRLY
jgi:predicted phosphodiesterase